MLEGAHNVRAHTHAQTARDFEVFCRFCGVPFSPHALRAFQSIERHLSFYPHNLSGYSYLDFAAWKASGRQETYLIHYMFHYIETGLEAKLTTTFPRSACPVCLSLAITGATQGVPCPPRGLWALGTFHSLSSAGTQE